MIPITYAEMLTLVKESWPVTARVVGFGLLTWDSIHGLYVDLGPARKSWQVDMFERHWNVYEKAACKRKGLVQ